MYDIMIWWICVVGITAKGGKNNGNSCAQRVRGKIHRFLFEFAIVCITAKKQKIDNSCAQSARWKIHWFLDSVLLRFMHLILLVSKFPKKEEKNPDKQF